MNAASEEDTMRSSEMLPRKGVCSRLKAAVIG